VSDTSEFPKKAIMVAAMKDVAGLEKAHANYGTSWKNRGGTGAFMMLARKWDRLENAVKKDDYNIFKTIERDKRAEGVMDDIRDLRRYLLLVEAEFEDVPEVEKDAPMKLSVEEVSRLSAAEVLRQPEAYAARMPSCTCDETCPPDSLMPCPRHG
jgi:hypothetical protein